MMIHHYCQQDPTARLSDLTTLNYIKKYSKLEIEIRECDLMEKSTQQKQFKVI